MEESRDRGMYGCSRNSEIEERTGSVGYSGKRGRG